MADLIYKELSFLLNGIAFKIDNELGFGQTEKVYGDAFEICLRKSNLSYEREKYYPIKIEDKIIAKRFIDFLVEDKVVVELKQGEDNYKKVCSQLFSYLKLNNLKLGLVIRFTKNGVRVKRIPCCY